MKMKMKALKLGSVSASFLKHGYSLDVDIITCLIKQENVEKAVELFKKLIKDKLCEVNEVTDLTLLNGLCKCGNVFCDVS
ncbi:hypothetical protein LIER_34286 [Lithospermum erythrorhizon]|uniref:Pentatricopeptide repeat-containing protein n=1 Tax=Lithospermum erythrorhizon TaxID=34254 RepID=A0AAV3RZW5_LITER